MNHDLWQMIVTLNNFLSPLRAADTQSSVVTVDLMQLRSKIRDQLVDLRTAITEHYSERDAYYVLFPLIAHCDEVIKKMNLGSEQPHWPPLQQEFYQVDDAGDLFYELLDSTLSKPETLGLVYEVYYFCLSDGFCGRYSGNPDMAANYLQKLRKHISLQPIAVSTETPPATRKRAYFRIPTYSHYILNVVLFIINYWFLTFMASTWQP